MKMLFTRNESELPGNHQITISIAVELCQVKLRQLGLFHNRKSILLMANQTLALYNVD